MWYTRFMSKPKKVKKEDANFNCLAGMRCPKCRALEPFRIEVRTLVDVYDDGTEPPGHGGGDEWMDESYCECLECGVEATVADFYTKNQTKKAK